MYNICAAMDGPHPQLSSRQKVAVEKGNNWLLAYKEMKEDSFDFHAYCSGVAASFRFSLGWQFNNNNLFYQNFYFNLLLCIFCEQVRYVHIHITHIRTHTSISISI